MIPIQRVYPASEWRTLPAAQIAAGLSAPAGLTPLSLTDFFGQVVAMGGNPESLGELWNVAGGRFVDRAEGALANGELAALGALLASIPADVKAAVGGATMAAIGAVVQANTLSAGRANWSPQDGEPPAEFSEEWVATTLAQAGYVWDGKEWALT